MTPKVDINSTKAYEQSGQAKEWLFNGLTSGTNLDHQVKCFLFDFEAVYLPIDPYFLNGRAILWAQSSGYGKSYVARAISTVLPCFCITLGPPLKLVDTYESYSKGRSESASLPAPDYTIVDWLEFWGARDDLSPTIAMAALIGAIYKQLFCLCVDELSRGHVKVDKLTAPYDAKKATEDGSNAKRDIVPFIRERHVSDIVAVTQSLNVSDWTGINNTKRNRFIDAVLKEASILLAADDLELGSGVQYLHELNVVSSIEAFMHLIDNAQDGGSVRLIDDDLWTAASPNRPYKARPTQSLIFWDECSHLNTIFDSEKNTSEGVPTLKRVLRDLFFVSNKETETHSEDAEPAKPQKAIDRVWCILMDITDELEVTRRDYPIYYSFGRDHQLLGEDVYNKSVKELHSIVDHLKLYGRGLWSPFLSMEVFAFAVYKLTGGAGQVVIKESITPRILRGCNLFQSRPIGSKASKMVEPIVFAVASYIIGIGGGLITSRSIFLEIEKRQSPWLDQLYLTQVAKHMRTIWKIDKDGIIETVALPEPMLSIAAMALVAYGENVASGDLQIEHQKNNIRKARLLENFANLTLDNRFKKIDIDEVGRCFARLVLAFATLDCFPEVWCPARDVFATYTTIETFLSKLYGTVKSEKMLEIINKQAKRRRDDRDVGKAIINFHQWTQIQDRDDTTTYKDSVGCDILDAIFQRLCAISLQKEDGDANRVHLMIPAVLPRKGRAASSVSIEDLRYAETETLYFGIQAKIDGGGHGSIAEVISSPEVEGTDYKCSLFNIIMDLSELNPYSEDPLDVSNLIQATSLPADSDTPSVIHFLDDDHKVIVTEDMIVTEGFETFNTTIYVRSVRPEEYPCLDLQVQGFDFDKVLEMIERVMINAQTEQILRPSSNPYKETTNYMKKSIQDILQTKSEACAKIGADDKV